MDDRDGGGNVPVKDEEREAARDLAAEMRSAGLGGAEVLLVLGSGLGEFVGRLENPRECPFGDLLHMARSTVPGHKGQFVRGRVEGREVLCQAGRVHLYEGHSPEVVTRAVRGAAHLGIPQVLLTNAAGGIEEGWPIPSLMRATGHLNMTHQEAPGTTSQRESGVYSELLGELLVTSARQAEVALESGVYAGMVGPGYETAAEIRWLRGLGASAVGMSTVLEAEAAHGAGMRVAAVSCITNPAAGIAKAALHHQEVVAAGAQAAATFAALVATFVGNLPKASA